MIKLYIYFCFNICFYLYTSPSFLDYAYNWQISFQDPATPVMEGIIALHHDLMFILTIIGSFVTWLLIRTTFLYFNKNNNIPSTLNHGTVIEIIWTITPSLILMVIAIPSFALLYSIDEVLDPVITFKIIGHQWYWSYEYSDFCDKFGNAIVFDSYMLNEQDLIDGQLRLLEVDNRVILPIKTHIRALITSTDVIHSWAIPSLGVKIDACPGRLNQVSIYFNRKGVFFGQCSEICGIQHAFMPIVIEALNINDFIFWVNVQTECENWLISKSKIS
jgi:cytochrome c oxidase subunit 2